MTEDRTKNKSKFRFAEHCLYNYQLNLAKIEVLEQKLELLKISSSAKAQSYDAMPCGGAVSRPVEQRAANICALEEQILYCKNCTIPITRMIEDLKKDYSMDESQNNNMLRLLELRYFAGGTWQQAAKKLNTSERTLMYWRQRLVKKTIEYLCL